MCVLCMLLRSNMTGTRTAIFIHFLLSLLTLKMVVKDFINIYIQLNYINFIFIHSVQYAV